MERELWQATSCFFPKEDIEDLQKIFKIFDADEDGMISYSELRMLMENLGKKIPERVLQTAMKMAGCNAGNLINMKEFIEMTTKGFDFEKVTKEVEKIMYSLGQGGLFEDCKRIVSSFDSNKDGTINFEELGNLMNNFFPSSSGSGSK